MTVIFVSHKLEEVEELCGRGHGHAPGSRGRRGRDAVPHGPAGPDDVRRRLVEVASGPTSPLGRRRCCAARVSSRRRHLRLEDLSLDVAGRRGHRAGRPGGQRPAHVPARHRGLLTPAAGTRRRERPRLHRARLPRAASSAGVGYLPAGRLEEGLVPGLSDHRAHRPRPTRRHGFFIDWRGAAANGRRAASREYAIKGRPARRSRRCPGGNQQRLLLALLPRSLRLLLMEHPTRGLDVESADYVWTRLLARREDGTAIVFASADLDELLRYSDRILVFFSGEVLAERGRAPRPTGDELGHLIGGEGPGGPRRRGMTAPDGPALPAGRSGAWRSSPSRFVVALLLAAARSSSPATTRSRRSGSWSRARSGPGEGRRHDHGLGPAGARVRRAGGHVRGRDVEHRCRGPDHPGRHRRRAGGAGGARPRRPRARPPDAGWPASSSAIAWALLAGRPQDAGPA